MDCSRFFEPETTNDKDTSAKTIVNLYAHALNKAEMGVLEKGLNFVVSPTSIPIDNFICCVEESIQNLTNEDKDLIRQDCSVILRKAKPPKRNISKEERIALKNLRNDENLVILKADKGGTTVLMNLSDYNRKMSEQLSQSGIYKKLICSSIKKIIR